MVTITTQTCAKLTCWSLLRQVHQLKNLVTCFGIIVGIMKPGESSTQPELKSFLQWYCWLWSRTSLSWLDYFDTNKRTSIDLGIFCSTNQLWSGNLNLTWSTIRTCPYGFVLPCAWRQLVFAFCWSARHWITCCGCSCTGTGFFKIALSRRRWRIRFQGRMASWAAWCQRARITGVIEVRLFLLFTLHFCPLLHFSGGQ